MNRSYNRFSPTFDYSSAFTYSRVSGNDDEDDNYHDDGEISFKTGQDPKKSDPIQTIIYLFLTLLSVLFLLITFPVSSFFCLKKINSFQRCLIYRLGRRLPMKGPGYVIQLPFIDRMCIIDLFENRFDLIEKEQQLLTGDGSIIMIKPCQAILNVTNALLTTLKINNVDVKDLLRIKFTNMIRCKHVEDLENKMDFVIKEFEENNNEFLKKWGYSVSMTELPRFTVLDRADPINPIKNQLQKWFNNDGQQETENQSNNIFLNLLGQVETSNKNVDDSLSNLTDVLQMFVNQYQSYLSPTKEYNLKLFIQGSMDKVYYFQYHNKQLRNSSVVLNPIHMTLQFDNQNNFDQFLITKDTQYLNFVLH